MKKVLLAALVTTLLQLPVSAQNKLSAKTMDIDIGGGFIYAKAGQAAMPVFSLDYRLRVACISPKIRVGTLCIDIRSFIIIRPPFKKDPVWTRMPPIVVTPGFPPPIGPTPDPWSNFDITQMKLGRAISFTPALALNWTLPNNRIELSALAGGGFEHAKGTSATVNGQTFRSTDVIAPQVTYGASFRYRISNGFSLKLDARALTTFMGNTQILGPDRSVATFEGMAMTVPVVSGGIGIGF
jgi:hypothetical protein